MQKRPGIGLTGFFIMGILAVAFKINMPVILVFTVAATILVFFLDKKRTMTFFIMIIALLMGILRMYAAEGHRTEVLRKFESKENLMTATVTEFGDGGKTVAEFSDEGKTYQIYLVIKSGRELSPGDIVKVRVTPGEPYTSKVSVFDFSAYLSSRDVYLYGYADDAQIIGVKKDGIKGFVYSVRRYIDKIGEDSFSGDSRALYNSVVFGDKRLLSPELSASLRISGLSHIAVVSGTHLSIMISVIMMLLGNFFGRQRRGRLVLIAGAVFITLITGAGASVVRALIMCILCQAAYFFRRENDSFSTLALSAFVMSAVNPYIIFNIGFILSAVSVLGIILFSEPLKSKISKFTGDIAGELLAVTLSAQLAVTPVLIVFFGILSPYSPLANLAVNFFSDVLVVCGMLFAVAAKIPVISEITAFLIRFSANAVIAVCDFIKTLPGASMEVEGSGVLFVSLWLFAVTVAYFLRKDKKLAIKITAIFAVFMLVFSAFSFFDNRKIKMEFVSYGKQEMTSVFFPDGRSILLECPDYSDAINIADTHHRKSYTYTIITGNSTWNTQKLSASKMTGTVIAYADSFSSEKRQTFEKAINSDGAEVVFLEDGESFYGEDFSVRFIGCNFAPVPEIEYKGRIFVSLQNLDFGEIEALVSSKTHFNCDYLKLPSHVPDGGITYSDLTFGQILREEKFFTINLY